MSLFEYPITRPIALGRYGMGAVLVCGLVFTVLITLFNIVAVGYELVTVSLTSFNPQYRLWYEGFIPKAWTPQSVNCTPATININEGSGRLVFANQSYLHSQPMAIYLGFLYRGEYKSH